MVRPRTVLRILFYGAITWLILATLWLGLPSPSRNDNGTNHPTSVLRSGKTLTRVYEIDKIFPYRKDMYASVQLARDSGRERLALTFRVDEPRDFLVVANEHQVPLLHHPDQVIVSGPLVVSAPAGDLDGINPPWFSKADATLLYWMVHRDEVVVTLRVRWIEGRTEVWADGESWATDPPSAPTTGEPLLALTLSPSNLTSGTAYKTIKVSTPHPPLSSSPSATYPIRVAILHIIAPTGLLVMGITAVLRFLFIFMLPSVFEVLLVALRFAGAAGIVLGVVWVVRGRPTQDAFVRGVWGVLRDGAPVGGRRGFSFMRGTDEEERNEEEEDGSGEESGSERGRKNEGRVRRSVDLEKGFDGGSQEKGVQ